MRRPAREQGLNIQRRELSPCLRAGFCTRFSRVRELHQKSLACKVRLFAFSVRHTVIRTVSEVIRRLRLVKAATHEYRRLARHYC